MEVLDNIPVRLDPGEVLKRLRLGNKSEHIENSVKEIIEYYGARWKIEAGFKEIKQEIGSAKS